MYVDGSTCNKGLGVRVVIFSLEGLVLLEQAVQLGFSASNNVAEYEALLAGLRNVEALKMKKLRVHWDSQLVVNKLFGEYEARNEKIVAYVEGAKNLLKKFGQVLVQLISSGQNVHANSLACLASVVPTKYRRTMAVECSSKPSVEDTEVVLKLELGLSWMDPIISYIRDETLPADKEAHKIKAKSSKFLDLTRGEVVQEVLSLAVPAVCIPQWWIRSFTRSTRGCAEDMLADDPWTTKQYLKAIGGRTCRKMQRLT